MTVVCLFVHLVGQLGEAASATLPKPDLSRMEPVVQRQVQEEIAALEKVIGQPGAEPAALADAFGRCGMVYAAYELSADAETCFRQAAERAPGDFRWPYYLGALAQKRNDLDAARTFFERVLTLRPGAAPARRRLGEIELAAGHGEAARADFTALLKEDAAFAAAAHYGLGRVEMLRGDAAGATAALPHFETAFAQQPNAAALHYQLGMAYRKLGQTDKARVHLAAFSGSPGESSVGAPDPLIDALAHLNGGTRQHVIAGTQALQAGNPAAAADELRKALAADPRDAGTWAKLGAAQERLNDAKGAEESYRQALAVDPSSVRAHYNLGSLLAERGERKEGIEHLEAALRLDPQLTDARFNLATALLETGEPLRALVQYDVLIQRSPGDAVAHYDRGTTLLLLGRAAEAEKELKEVAAAAPEAVEPAASHARALAALGRFAEAAAEQRRAVDLAGKSGRSDLPALRACLQQLEQGHPCPAP
jgi:tetratricopeptide (TPR) repeat protein